MYIVFIFAGEVIKNCQDAVAVNLIAKTFNEVFPANALL